MISEYLPLILIGAVVVGVAWTTRTKGEGVLPPAPEPVGTLDGDLICNHSGAAADALAAGDFDEALGICLRAIEAQERQWAVEGPGPMVDPMFYTKAAHALGSLDHHDKAADMLMRYVRQCAKFGQAPAEYVTLLQAKAIERKHDAMRRAQAPATKKVRKRPPQQPS